MPVVKAQCTYALDDALPENAMTNTWYAQSLTATPLTIATSFRVALETFYTSIDQSLYPITMSTTMTMKFYDMADAEPRVPILTSSVTLTPSASNAFPNEVALCLSFAGEAVSGVPQARRRGRVYLGPLNGSSSFYTPTSSGIRPSPNILDIVLDACEAMQLGLSTSDVLFGVWSSTNREAGMSVDNSFTPAVVAWMDDAYDTQRRRGPAAASRDTRLLAA